MLALTIQNTNKSPVEVQRIMRTEYEKAMRESVTFGEAQIAPRTPVGVTGHTRQGIVGKVINPLHGEIGIQGPASRYGEFVESGRRPGKFPPSAAIELWLRRTDRGRRFVASVKAKYGIKTNDAALKQATFLKQKGIGRRGTRGAFMFKESVNAIAADAQRNFQSAIVKIEKQVGDK